MAKLSRCCGSRMSFTGQPPLCRALVCLERDQSIVPAGDYCLDPWSGTTRWTAGSVRRLGERARNNDRPLPHVVDAVLGPLDFRCTIVGRGHTLRRPQNERGLSAGRSHHRADSRFHALTPSARYVSEATMNCGLGSAAMQLAPLITAQSGSQVACILRRHGKAIRRIDPMAVRSLHPQPHPRVVWLTAGSLCPLCGRAHRERLSDPYTVDRA